MPSKTIMISCPIFTFIKFTHVWFLSCVPTSNVQFQRRFVRSTIPESKQSKIEPCITKLLLIHVELFWNLEVFWSNVVHNMNIVKNLPAEVAHIGLQSIMNCFNMMSKKPFGCKLFMTSYTFSSFFQPIWRFSFCWKLFWWWCPLILVKLGMNF